MTLKVTVMIGGVPPVPYMRQVSEREIFFTILLLII